ncbi:SRPBCC domain-containing protein [Paraburkholderia sp. A3BS-1L]|uniref:SRPBCC family protein n=2 Tax=Paraburkholderia TaxID=1822464 RepID=UPI003DA90A45
MVRRRIDASVAKVYAAWTQAAQLMRWMHPLDTICLHAEADVRVGGRFRVIMRSPGGEEYDASGTYLDVVPEAKLVFTWAWRSEPERESRVTVVLRADGPTTEVMLRHERFLDEATRDAHREGWSSALDRLVELFE